MRRKPEVELDLKIYVGACFLPVFFKTVPGTNRDTPTFDVEIGQIHMPLNEWLRKYKKRLGKFEYPPEEIEQYGRVLRWLKDVLDMMRAVPKTNVT
jgi:hypothetical protein